MGFADSDEGPDRWSLDPLLSTRTRFRPFVEVRRSGDTRLRREVVGQMLDYAANASAYWDAGLLRSGFESRFDSTKAADDELAAFIEEELEPSEFWEAVAANLKKRRLRLVFVADRIPAELRSIVEFLNEQLELTEVIAVDVKQYTEPQAELRATEARRVRRPPVVPASAEAKAELSQAGRCQGRWGAPRTAIRAYQSARPPRSRAPRPLPPRRARVPS
jgi:hypothetical protein